MRAAISRRGLIQIACFIFIITGSVKYSWGDLNRLQLLSCNTEALAARLQLISNAQNEIAVSSYHIEPGQATDLLFEALTSAASRGVQVRLLLDALNMELKPCQLTRLQQAGVSIRLFHPLGNGGVHWLNRRLHSKLLVVDQQLLIIGSRNLRDKHFGLGQQNYVDVDIAIEGSTAKTAAAYFDWIWNSKQVRALNAQGEVGVVASITAAPAAANFPFEFAPRYNAETCGLYDANFEKSERRMQEHRIAWVKSAKQSLVIETPYPAFAKTTLSAICESARRGVNVEIYTNSLATTDQKLAFAAFKNSQRRLLAAGVKIYEFRGPETLHAKLMLIDGHTAVIGSHNFDSRSDNFNLEFCVHVTSPDLVSDAYSILWKRMGHSRQLATARIDRSQPLFERIGLRARQLVAPVLRPLL